MCTPQLRITNGKRSPPCSGGSGYAKHCSGFTLCNVLLRHIFTVTGTLRVPLSQQQKRRLPRTLGDIKARMLILFVDNLWKIIYNNIGE